MQQDTNSKFESELKLKALATGITELIGLAILLAYIVSNITSETDILDEAQSAEEFDGSFSTNGVFLINNEHLTCLASAILVTMLICILFTIGVQKGKRWLMIPHIVIHVVAIAFFAVVWIILGVRFKDDGWLVLNVSMCAAFLIGFTSMIFKPAFTYFLFLEIITRMNKDQTVLPIAV